MTHASQTLRSEPLEPSSVPITHLLRMEGVNLDAFLLDTRDLSTIRGGSLLILEAVEAVSEYLSQNLGKANVEVISTGASIGLFGVALTDSGPTPTVLRDTVATLLRTVQPYTHATFVVDIEPLQGRSFQATEARVLARNRFAQYRAATVAIPAETVDILESPCSEDGLRPRGEKSKWSMATRLRKEYGREQKQALYVARSRVEGKPDLTLPYSFAQHFQELAAKPAPTGNLANKLAIFYVDGNDFGKIQRDRCKTLADQQQWDQFIRRSRQTWFRAFLSEELLGADAGSEWISSENRYRFETLLWGGDELMFVVPAWKGFRLAQHFFQHSHRWDLRDSGLCRESRPLTHAGALVFCHVKAPIHRIKHLAKDGMAEFVKTHDRTRDGLAVQVLESFDHLSAGYEGSLVRTLGDACAPSDLLLMSAKPDAADDSKTPKLPAGLGERLQLMAGTIGDLRNSSFPRSHLRHWVAECVAGALSDRAPDSAGKPKYKPDFGEQLARFSGGDEKIRTGLRRMREGFANDAAFWCSLEMLWDYAR